MRILVTAASRYGSTTEIAQAIGQVLGARGFETTVAPPEDLGALSGFDAVVLGSGLYVGHWLGPAVALAQRIGTELPRHPVWLFSSGPLGDPTSKFARQMAVDPVELPRLRELTGAREHMIFAGKLDRRRLRGIQRVGLAIFRSLDGDFRDWEVIRAWAGSIADQLGAAAAA